MYAQSYNQGGEILPSPSKQFDDIAFLYDELMIGVPYRHWVDYIQRLLHRHRIFPATTLDLCCGTGRVSRMLNQQGYAVTGVDISPEMIEIAKKKSKEEGCNIDFFIQDACLLRLGRKFDLIIALFDSFNYILESSQIQQAFYRVAEHLSSNGLFIFDMNTELALASGLFTQDNFRNRDAPIRYNWHGSYDCASRICRVHMEFFFNKDGIERKSESVHYQRAYDTLEIVEMLDTAGMQTDAVYDAYNFNPPGMKSDRVFFVVRLK